MRLKEISSRFSIEIKNNLVGKKFFAAEGTLIAIMIFLIVFLSLASEFFFTAENLTNLVRHTSIVGVVAIGMTFVIISGGIDLSVGSVLGLSGMVAAILMRDGVSIIVAVAAGIVSGTVVGVINGIIIHKGKVPPFIATMGSMIVVRGVIMLISGARMVSGIPREFTNFSQISFAGLPALFITWLVIIVLANFTAKRTLFGRNIYAIGSNEEAARLSGISIQTNVVKVYALCSFTAAIAGIMMTARLANGVPTGGDGFELDAIAAAVIGGASLSGAEGTILGTVLGAFIMAMLRNGGTLMGINPFILQIAIGTIVVVAVLIDKQKKNKQQKRNR